MSQRASKAKALARHRELLEIERALWSHRILPAGLDEAGAGPLAGPVVAACVVLDPDRASALVGVDDSKQLSASRRVEMAEVIRANALASAVREASVEEIDRLNIRVAGLLAMRRAFEAVRAQFDDIQHLLVDARTVPEVELPQSELVRGDSRSLSIAAASILAKVSRDETMVAAARSFPEFGFERHKGYGTKDHLEAIARFGLTPLHRLSFSPVRAAAEQRDLFRASVSEL